MAVGRAQRQHLPPRLAGVGEPVDPRVGVRARGGRRAARSGAAGRRWKTGDRSRDVWQRFLWILRPNAGTQHQGQPPAHRHPVPGADRRRRALPGQARRGRHGRASPPTSSATATRSCARSCATAARAAAAGSSRRCGRSTRTSTACAGRASSRSTRWAAGSGRSRPGATSSPPGATSCSARSPPAQEDLARRAVRGRRAARAGRGPRQGRRQEDDRGGARRARGPRLADRLRARPRPVRRHGARLRAHRRVPARHAAWSIEVDRVAAAFASWYELFPRSWGGLKAVEKQIPAIAELGFDVLYFPPIHPIGVKARKGRNNTLTAGPDDPGSPYAIGGKEGGHDAVHPELGTMDDVRSLTRDRARARHGRRARPRAQLLARPPVAQGAPGVVPAAPRRHAQVRREPAQALPGHLQLQLGHAGLARAVAGVARRRRALGRGRASSSSASTTRTRSRSRSGSG